MLLCCLTNGISTMITDYEKFLVLMGMGMRKPDLWKQDMLGDEMDKLWKRLGEYQRGCSRNVSGYANRIAGEID